jgi:hypothetical protein
LYSRRALKRRKLESFSDRLVIVKSPIPRWPTARDLQRQCKHENRHLPWSTRRPARYHTWNWITDTALGTFDRQSSDVGRRWQSKLLTHLCHSLAVRIFNIMISRHDNQSQILSTSRVLTFFLRNDGGTRSEIRHHLIHRDDIIPLTLLAFMQQLFDQFRVCTSVSHFFMKYFIPEFA